MRHYCDYFLLLSPNEHVNEVVQQHKQYAANVIGSYPSEHSKAHISVERKTRQKAFIAEPLLESMKTGMRSLPPINLTIDGFDYFNHGSDYRTIYASLRSNHVTTLWFKTLKKQLNLREFMVPHITVCRNIPVADFEKLWPYFKAINWVEHFTIDELTILQRETLDTFAKWQPYLLLPFEAKRLNTPPPPKISLLKPDLRLQNGQMSLF